MTNIWEELLAPVPRPPRPMLANALETEQLSKLQFPFLASLKIDGYRGVFWQGAFYSRSGKKHPSPAVQALARRMQAAGYPDLDGELLLPQDSFNTGGGKLRRQGEAELPGLKFLVFDVLQDELPFFNRWELYSHLEPLPGVEFVRQVWVENLTQLLDFEAIALEAGFEGVVIRKPSAKYKHGRGTLRDQVMLKLKRFHTAEARVLSVSPRKFNSNAATQSPLGYTERSTAKDGLLETNVLGTLHCIGLNGPFAELEFQIGDFRGLTDQDKIQLLAEPPIGKVCTFKYFPQGLKEKPRHPVWLSWRPEWDIDSSQTSNPQPSNKGETLDEKETK